MPSGMQSYAYALNQQGDMETDMTTLKIQPRTDKAGETHYVIVDADGYMVRGDLPDYRTAADIRDLIDNPTRDILAQI